MLHALSKTIICWFFNCGVSPGEREARRSGSGTVASPMANEQVEDGRPPRNATVIVLEATRYENVFLYVGTLNYVMKKIRSLAHPSIMSLGHKIK